MSRKYLTRSSAVETVRRIFVNTNEDSISIEDTFRAMGRDLSNSKANRVWLSNKLTDLKHHELVTPIYSFDKGYRVLKGLKLTLDGKREIGRVESINKKTSVNLDTDNDEVTLGEVMKMVAKLKEVYQDKFDINFDIKLKDNVKLKGV